MIDQKLIHVQTGAIKWLYENLKAFELSLESYKKSYFRVKALGELALLISLYKRKYAVINNNYIKDFIAFVSDTVIRANFIDRMMRRPDLFLAYLGIYESLNECGIQLKGFKDSLQSLIAQKYVIAAERAPFRNMDLCYSLNRAKLNHTLPSLEHLYYRTVLSKDPPVLFLQEIDVYSITHIIFYLSDFGFKTKINLSNRQLMSIRWIIGTLIGLYLFKKNWDILAELLLCCYCLRWFPSPLYHDALQNLLNAQRADGAIPGPDFIEKDADEMDHDKLKRYVFEKNYHTTLISAIVCFMTIRQRIPHSNDINFLVQSRDKLPLTSAKVAFRQAYEWLKSVQPNFSNDHYDYSSLLYILMSEWIYNVVFGTHNLEALRFTADRIRHNLDAFQSCESEERLINCDTALVLLGTGILRKLKLKSKRLESFVEIIFTTLDNYKPKTFTEKIDLFPTHFLAYKLGNIKTSSVSDCEQVHLHKPRYEFNQLIINKSCMRNLTSYIAYLTSYGLKRPHFELNIMSHLYTALQSSVFYCLNEYNLDLGLLLLRTMGYLRMRNTRSFKQAIDFIIWQQRLDGKFGFFAPEVSQLLLTDAKFNDIYTLYLPITTSAIWTIAEAINPKFNLFHSI